MDVWEVVDVYEIYALVLWDYKVAILAIIGFEGNFIHFRKTTYGHVSIILSSNILHFFMGVLFVWFGIIHMNHDCFLKKFLLIFLTMT